MEKDEMRDYFRQFKTSPRSESALIRTGCIPCLTDRVKCDGTSPKCKKTSISTEWRINSSQIWGTQGTWRERRGIHSFISFALAPERTGLFGSSFWQTVMQACFSHDAVFHIACAVGSLQEQILQQATTRARFNDIGGLAFALRQCNQAITLLVASTNDAEDRKCDPGIPLITCVLFAIFEALNGDSDQAINHSLQGRKLLSNCEMLSREGRGSHLVDPMSVRPVIGGLEIQAKAIQGRHMDTEGADAQPPMPDVERIHSLEHANWTLQHTYISILIFCQSVSLAMSRSEILSMMRWKSDFFVPWLRQWEIAFSGYLFREAKQMSLHDMQRAKVLKANH